MDGADASTEPAAEEEYEEEYDEGDEEEYEEEGEYEEEDESLSRTPRRGGPTLSRVRRSHVRPSVRVAPEARPVMAKEGIPAAIGRRGRKSPPKRLSRSDCRHRAGLKSDQARRAPSQWPTRKPKRRVHGPMAIRRQQCPVRRMAGRHPAAVVPEESMPTR